MTSIGLRPAVLFFSLTGVNTAASISARKLSNGTTRAIISSGSPFAVIAASRLSASKNPNCPIVPPCESCCHNSDSHKSAEVAIFRGPLRWIGWHVLQGAIDHPHHVVVGLLRGAKDFADGRKRLVGNGLILSLVGLDLGPDEITHGGEHVA